MRRRMISAVMLFLLLLLTFRCCADASFTCELRTDEWTWNPGKVATMSGTVLNSGDQPADTVFRLELLDLTAEDPGRVAFTMMNGSRVLVRKQKETYSATVGAGETYAFSASWFLPEEMNGIDRVTVRLTVLDPDGNELARSEIRMGGETVEQNDSRSARVIHILGLSVPVLLAGAAVLWGLAVLRYCLIRKKKESNTK